MLDHFNVFSYHIFPDLLPLVHPRHICHKDIAWSDLLTEAVYSTHLREKPDQGPSCLECIQICGEFWSKWKVTWPNMVENDLDCEDVDH